MDRINYCYHTHTMRCGHASGSDEEYVQAAIKIGIKRLGFSDHIILPRGYEQPWVRGDYSLLDDYIDSINHLKEKYKDQIEIHVGFEAEYFEPLIPYYKELLDSGRIEYLILGQHFRINEEGKIERYFTRDCSFDRINLYTNDLIKGIETGLFKYVAHPDLYVDPYKVWSKPLEKAANKILKACKKNNIPIEINLGGMRWKGVHKPEFGYPNDDFWEVASKYNLDVVIGFDAHAPNEFSEEDMQKGVEMAMRHNLRLIDYKI